MTPHDLRQIRHNTGLSQKEFGDKLGIKADSIRGWERFGGHISDNVKALYRLVSFNPQMMFNILAEQKHKETEALNEAVGQQLNELSKDKGVPVETLTGGVFVKNDRTTLDESDLLELLGANWK